MLEKSDFFQADDIHKVFSIVDAVNNGYTSDDALESYIGLDSNARQGRYYRLAAVNLGLIENINNTSTLTSLGQKLLNCPAQGKVTMMQSLISSHPVFSDVINHCRNNQAITSAQLKDYFINLYPGEKSTAERRFSTFRKYVEFIELPII